MASSKPNQGPQTHAALRKQLLKEEEMVGKFKEFSKFIKSWERGRVICLQLKSQENSCFAKNRQRQEAEMKEEMHYANEELMMVRRAALRHLLSTEHLQYQLELNHLGMSFYAERL
ncbi:cilia- and flagella-associated protein 141 [Candoia aspera]|uniref:cilia- and flagella-associated protein 141 n=1 Tax=Candoia aspera TaxID=51853 RepID=UPI002FD85060